MSVVPARTKRTFFFRSPHTLWENEDDLGENLKRDNFNQTTTNNKKNTNLELNSLSLGWFKPHTHTINRLNFDKLHKKLPSYYKRMKKKINFQNKFCLSVLRVQRERHTHTVCY